MSEQPADSPVSQVERVYQGLREAIIDGVFLPGAPLRLQDLTDRFHVSLIPIREAMRKLEVERLVESIPNKGARVAEISPHDVEDAYATRVVLELEALRRAWDRLDPALVVRLRALRAETLEGYARHQSQRAADAHRALHGLLYEQAQSPWLSYLIEILWSHTERYRRLALHLRTTLDGSDDYHGRILDAIAAGDREAAGEALREDLLRTARLITGYYAAREEGGTAAVG